VDDRRRGRGVQVRECFGGFNGIEINKMKMIPTVGNSGFLRMTRNLHVN